MTKTTVRKHDRKGTKGVRQHSRSLPATKKVPHNKHQHKPSWKLAKTKDELKAMLDAENISYDASATKADLIALIEA